MLLHGKLVIHVVHVNLIHGLIRLIRPAFPPIIDCNATHHLSIVHCISTVQAGNTHTTLWHIMENGLPCVCCAGLEESMREHQSLRQIPPSTGPSQTVPVNIHTRMHTHAHTHAPTHIHTNMHKHAQLVCAFLVSTFKPIHTFFQTIQWINTFSYTLNIWRVEHMCTETHHVCETNERRTRNTEGFRPKENGLQYSVTMLYEKQPVRFYFQHRVIWAMYLGCSVNETNSSLNTVCWLTFSLASSVLSFPVFKLWGCYKVAALWPSRPGHTQGHTQAGTNVELC